MHIAIPVPTVTKSIHANAENQSEFKEKYYPIPSGRNRIISDFDLNTVIYLFHNKKHILTFVVLKTNTALKPVTSIPAIPATKIEATYSFIFTNRMDTDGIINSAICFIEHPDFIFLSGSGLKILQRTY